MLLRILSRHERQAFANLLLALPRTDRATRFFAPASDAAVLAHAERFDWHHGRIIGAYDDHLELVGAVEYLPDASGRHAEAAFEVLPRARRTGVGQALMDEVIELARCEGCERLGIEFLADNEPMRRLATRAGMTVISPSGSERVAQLVLSPAGAYERLLRHGTESHAQWRFLQAGAARATARVVASWTGTGAGANDPGAGMRRAA